ncbi:aldo/keto reductase [Acuticoccus sp. MNP-M23]|uniref:aldo/keto reductase n=1 Tax=Acuticoccus sp. MNP-M23 TaxID=3072793 RepID=UPI002815C214|nr:aldo/keto reductase [Acuticoccus sp. MNP-M23]WMS44945.1 aldo/keto reductase [Acuticoccus sp. MNP-M23]
MERVTLAKDLEFSRLVYGMWRLADKADRSERTVRAKIDACLAQGITTFDQADVYGNYESEAVFGAVLKADPSLRDRIEIATKCGIKLVTDKAPERQVKHYDTSAAHITASAEQSLAKMGIERLDLLMVHRPDPLMDHEATGAALDALVAAGKVRAVGVSNFKPHDITLLQSAMQAPIVANQIELSVLHTAPFTDGDLAFLQEHDLAAMAWSPLAGGKLFAPANAALATRLAALGRATGGDISAAALAWLLAHPARILPVVGTNNLERIAMIGKALDVTIDREVWFEIYQLSRGQEVA